MDHRAGGDRFHGAQVDHTADDCAARGRCGRASALVGGTQHQFEVIRGRTACKHIHWIDHEVAHEAVDGDARGQRIDIGLTDARGIVCDVEGDGLRDTTSVHTLRGNHFKGRARAVDELHHHLGAGG